MWVKGGTTVHVITEVRENTSFTLEPRIPSFRCRTTIIVVRLTPLVYRSVVLVVE